MNHETNFEKFAHFLRLTAKIGCRDPRDLKHVLGIALQAAKDIADTDADTRSIPCVDIADLGSGSLERVTTATFRGIPASISSQEALALGLLVRQLSVRRLFEFGTYKGVSTTQLALNIEPGSEIFTLDLPETSEQQFALEVGKQSEREIAAEEGKGSLIPADLLPLITFLRQDSATFDPRPYASSIDLVFVDGAHSADYVRNDSEKGWSMLRPGGVILWHDCVPSHPDVVRYVKNCSFGACRISGTSLAMATKPAGDLKTV